MHRDCILPLPDLSTLSACRRGARRPARDRSTPPRAVLRARPPICMRTRRRPSKSARPKSAAPNRRSCGGRSGHTWGSKTRRASSASQLGPLLHNAVLCLLALAQPAIVQKFSASAAGKHAGAFVSFSAQRDDRLATVTRSPWLLTAPQPPSLPLLSVSCRSLCPLCQRIPPPPLLPPACSAGGKDSALLSGVGTEVVRKGKR
jgi:hypothetical protein